MATMGTGGAGAAGPSGFVGSVGVGAGCGGGSGGAMRAVAVRVARRRVHVDDGRIAVVRSSGADVAKPRRAMVGGKEEDSPRLRYDGEDAAEGEANEFYSGAQMDTVYLFVAQVSTTCGDSGELEGESKGPRGALWG